MKTLTKQAVGIIAALSLVSVAGCSNDDTPSASDPGVEPFTPITLSGEQEDMVGNANAFSLSLIDKSLAMTDKNGNFCFSPLGIYLDLSMLANGASGSTYEEIVSALGLEDHGIGDINTLNRKLISQITTQDRTVTAFMANSIWHADGLKIKKGFVDDMNTLYSADCMVISDNFIHDLNRWCSEKTDGLIGEYATVGNVPATLLLTDALLFKGSWAPGYTFDPALTKTDIFNNADGTSSSVPFMSQKNTFKAFCDERMDAVSLDLGNGAYSLYLAMPRAGVPLADCTACLGTASANLFRPSGIELNIPRLDIVSDNNLNALVAATGIRTIFSAGADFSNMTDLTVAASEIRQSLRMQVDETGAKGAAVSSVDFSWTSPSADSGTSFVSLTFDRPFLFAVTEKSTGMILFAGCIETL